MRTFNKKILLYVAIFILFIPSLRMLVGSADDASTENRELTASPSALPSIANLQTWVAQLDAYYADHFGFRSFLVSINSLFRYCLFNTSTSQSVTVGKDGWLFVDWDTTIPDLKGLNSIPPRDLRRWRIQLEERQDWLQDQGIDFLAVLVPMKQIIYHEHLPSWIQFTENTAYDQFVRHLKQFPNIHCIDVRPYLLKAKPYAKLYFKRDTHWNSFGAITGYRCLAKEIPQYFDPSMAFNTTPFSKLSNKKTNLTRMMGLEFNEPFLIPSFSGATSKIQSPTSDLLNFYDKNGCPLTIFSNPEQDNKLVFAGDSYMYSGCFQDMVAQGFKRSIFINLWVSKLPQIENFPTPLILEEKPDIVIYEMSSSRIGNKATSNLFGNPYYVMNIPEVRQARLKKLFDLENASRITYDRYQTAIRSIGNKKWRFHLFHNANIPQGKYILKVHVRSSGESTFRILDGRSNNMRLKYAELENVKVWKGNNTVYLTSFPPKDNYPVAFGVDNLDIDIGITSVEVCRHPDVTLPASQYIQSN